MTKQTFSNELERALARTDINRLVHLTGIYEKWEHVADKKAYYEKLCDDLDEWMMLPSHRATDEDKAVALVILVSASSDDPKFLALVAAGLLENLLIDPSDEILERIIIEARKTARFRWMLSGVYNHAIKNAHAREMIAKAVGNICLNDPLPPRPFV
jgi:hypothetical protein